MRLSQPQPWSRNPEAGYSGREVAGNERQCLSAGLLRVAAALHHPGWAGKQVENMARGTLPCFHAGTSPATRSNTGDLADACDNVSVSS